MHRLHAQLYWSGSTAEERYKPSTSSRSYLGLGMGCGSTDFIEGGVGAVMDAERVSIPLRGRPWSVSCYVLETQARASAHVHAHSSCCGGGKMMFSRAGSS